MRLIAKHLKVSFALLSAIILGGLVGAPPASAAMVRSGVLECTVAPGIGLIVLSSKRLTCTYRPERGRPQLYAGRITKVGLDIGVTGRTVIVWAVLSSQVGFPYGALAGSYGGVSAEASVGLGVGANALIGGTGRSFVLQPFSVQAQTGLNLAAGITALTLFIP
jgi:hypothetical protein